MKIIVDIDLCEGNGVCEGLAPELFRVDDSGQLHIRATAAPTSELRDRAARAVRYCPRNALRIEDERPTNPPERSQP